MKKLPIKLVNDCKKKLLETKEDLLNRQNQVKAEMRNLVQRGGDEGDQMNSAREEMEFVRKNERLNLQILEIENALARIEAGNFGVCEETGEHIEPKRLEAIPWTRLSFEGAEIREEFQNMGKRQAR